MGLSCKLPREIHFGALGKQLLQKAANTRAKCHRSASYAVRHVLPACLQGAHAPRNATHLNNACQDPLFVFLISPTKTSGSKCQDRVFLTPAHMNMHSIQIANMWRDALLHLAHAQMKNCKTEESTWKQESPRLDVVSDHASAHLFHVCK